MWVQLKAQCFAVFLSCFACAGIAIGQGEPASSATEKVAEGNFRLQIHVTDEASEPIPQARCALVRWSGKYTLLEENNTDEAGNTSLETRWTDNYFYLLVQADGYGITMPSVLVSSGELKQLDLKLSRAAEAYIVVTANGKPVAGAEFERLEFGDKNGVTTHLGSSTPLPGLEFSKSDAQGRLALPPIPLGSKVACRIVHPQWKQQVVPQLPIADGEFQQVEMQAGVPVTFYLKDDEGESLPDGTAVKVAAFSSDGSTHQRLFAHDGKVELAVQPTEFREIRLVSDSHFIGPTLMNQAGFTDSRMDLKKGSPANFQLEIYRKEKASGRVVDRDGNGVASALVVASASRYPGATLSDTISVADTDFASRMEAALGQWISAGYAETDEDGYYTLDAVRGRARFEVICEGYFSDPGSAEFDWSSPDEKFPEVSLFRVPFIKGQVLDAEGQPRAGMLVRLVHEGWGDADPVSVTNEKGEFELELLRIPYAQDSEGLQTRLGVMAFDPASESAGLTLFDVRDESAASSVVVTLSEKPEGWILNPFAKETQRQIPDEEWEKVVAEQMEKFTKGKPGNNFPLLYKGTWLNTNAKSIADFKGKLILLDCWFIGCGPCEREMPQIKIAYDAFKDLGFTVISFHKNGQTPEAVAEFAAEHRMDYPIFVDNADGICTKELEDFGLEGYPTYMLIGPDGKILHNDTLLHSDYSLRMSKLEFIHQAIHAKQE